ncbi:cbb3-type cytochrome c oxidase N-terminal domain-containing protein [Chitinophaga lutea]
MLKRTLLPAFLLMALSASAQPVSEGQRLLSDPVALLLVCVAVGLLIAIIALGLTVLSAIDLYREKMKNTPPAVVLLLIATLLAGPAQAASDAPVAAAPTVLSGTTLFIVGSVIAIELLVILFLLRALRVLTGIERQRKAKKAAAPKPRYNWFEKLNKTKTVDAVSEEAEDMGHDYDGIRELNNPTPPWWRWGFYASILFGVIYIWRFHVTHSAPSQLEELAIAQAEAAVQKEAYLKNAANNIDENNVTLLSAADDIAAGKGIFASSCAPCHGQDGQGVVGPNLTDDHWIHGGQLKVIFSTIKYGVPEKGMKSWKEDFSPKQLAQLTSYIKSIHGTKPANPKAPEGALYQGE